MQQLVLSTVPGAGSRGSCLSLVRVLANAPIRQMHTLRQRGTQGQWTAEKRKAIKQVPTKKGTSRATVAGNRCTLLVSTPTRKAMLVEL